MIVVKKSKSTPVKTSKADLEKAIQKKAHELFVKRGHKHGDDFKDWLEAEKIVKKQLGVK